MVKYSRRNNRTTRKYSKKNKGGSDVDNDIDGEMNNLDISGIHNMDDSDNIHDINDFNDNELNFEDEMEDTLNTTNDSISLPDTNNQPMVYEYNSDSGDMDSLHLSDLNTSNNSSMNTTKEDNSFGGKSKRKRRKTKKRITRKSKKTKTRKNKTRKNKTRKIKIGGNVNKLGDSDFNPNLSYDSKQNGGRCYGTGVGANSYDPNFSIYNTKLLTLNPYKPTN